ncbi:MAG: replicative DNA helicase [Herpetosiphonaceae bacterium]|nr:replicative DNA helicase [Herpetosiphonaceae bacterium]
MDKSLPADLNAERATLGSILLDRDAVIPIAPWLFAEYFYVDKHAAIYDAQLACYNRRVPPDIVNVTDELRRQDRLDSIGGIAYLLDLSNSVPTAVHVEYYARIVERTALLRRLITAGGKIAALGYDETENLEATLDKAETELFAVSQRRANEGFVHIGQVVDSFFDHVTQMQEKGGEVVGLKTGFNDFDKLTGGLQRSDLLILAARPATGKCLPWWTLIDDPDTGERVTLEACVQRKLPHVFGIDSLGNVRPANVSAWIDSGVQPCYRVQTQSGRVVEVTGHHPFLTVDGWTPLHDLAVGTSIGVPRVVPAFGHSEDWSLDYVRLLAYFIAEGGLTGTSPAFTNTDPIIIEDFRAIVERHFPVCALRQERITYKVAQPKRPQPGRGGIMPPNPVTVWLKELGLMGKLSKDKIFPACVWTWSRTYLAEFLRVLMSCDGSIYSHDGEIRIEFCVASQQLALDVFHAFTRFGIVSKYSQKNAGAWRVCITDTASLSRYQEQIGWIGEKASRGVDWNWNITVRGGNSGHPPAETWKLVKTAKDTAALSWIELARQSGETVKTGKYGGYNAHTKRSLPQYRLAGYAHVLDNNDLRRIANPDLYWDKIVAITPIGEHQVYDLTVPDGANFIAQDVCVHNTSLALNIAYHAALHEEATVAIFSLEMSRDQLMQRILATHTGVDMQKLRTGQIRDSDLQTITEALGVLSSLPIYIDDSPGITSMDVRSKCRRLQAETGIDLIIIDYLQLMQGGGKRDGNRVQEISEISRGLKALAREVNVPVIALSQLSRAVESRTSHIPMLSDLRESGCITGDSLVYLPDEGVYRRIDALVGQTGFNVLAVNTATWKLEPRPVTNAFATGIKLVYTLQTKSGRTIRATANHKFLTIEGWKRLDELTPGERLAVPRSLPGPADQTMSDAELGLLAHLIGDGCTLARQPIHYTTADVDVAEIVAGLAKEVFADAVLPRINPELQLYQVYLAAGYHLTHKVRNPVAKWLDGMGVFDLRSHEKRVPEQVFRQSNEAIACFLRHLWATDGCIWVSTSGKVNVPKVYYATSSVELARNVQSLLLRLSINVTIFTTPQPGKGRDIYQVAVSGRTDMLRFISVIGAVGQRKQQSLAALEHYFVERTEKTGRDVIPREVWPTTILPRMQLVGMKVSQLAQELGYASQGGLTTQNLSRQRAMKIANIIDCATLTAMAQSDIYWDSIATITPAGEEPVYDLTVDGLHNFVANDLTLHNSIEQDADIVMFIYREELYDPDTDKKGIAEIHLAKHRNGPTGIVPLRFFKSTTRFANLETYRQPEGY